MSAIRSILSCNPETRVINHLMSRNVDLLICRIGCVNAFCLGYVVHFNAVRKISRDYGGFTAPRFGVVVQSTRGWNVGGDCTLLGWW